MVITRTLDEFIQHNHSELVGMAKSMGVLTRDNLHDTLQAFCLKLPSILTKYDPARSKFSSFIYSCLHNFIETERSQAKKKRTCELTDTLTYENHELSISLRIADFRRYCLTYGMAGTERVLAELDNRIQDATTASCFSGTYKNYLQAFLGAESL